MTPHATWSPEAIRDLEEIGLYIAVHDARPATADRIVLDAHKLCDLIATQPQMGEKRPEFGKDCRCFAFEKRWMILYRPATDGIDVLRIVDATRDFDRLF